MQTVTILQGRQATQDRSVFARVSPTHPRASLQPCRLCWPRGHLSSLWPVTVPPGPRYTFPFVFPAPLANRRSGKIRLLLLDSTPHRTVAAGEIRSTAAWPWRLRSFPWTPLWEQGPSPMVQLELSKGKESETLGVKRKAGLLWIFFFLILTLLTTNELRPFTLSRASCTVLGS